MMADDFDPTDAKGSIGTLLNFDHMIGPSLIRVIYFSGLVLVVVYAVGGLGTTAYFPVAGLLGSPGGAILLVFVAVMWRFTCELWVLMFKIHDRAGEVRDRLPPR
jgi:hypothetical protein